MRVLALDHGTKRVGVALSDELATIARPLEFIPAQPEADCIARIKEITDKNQVGQIIVGLPRNMNGTYGPAAESAQKFAAILRETIGLPVRTWDERLTSVQANRFLIEAGMRREQRKIKVDQSAAAILLQSFLDATSSATPESGDEAVVNYKLTIAYDGTNYAGWQAQKTGISVQERVEEAIQKIFPTTEVSRLHSSSRTDAGVHALGMVATIEIPQSQMVPSKLALAINAHLAPDIRVMGATRCGKDFDARFEAKGKQYRYYVWNGPAMNPLLNHRAWHVAKPLDLAAMRTASKYFPGKRDFKSLAATRNYEMKSTVRNLRRCEIKRNGPLLTFVIEGDGFLYKMCRGIVGTLVQVGQGRIAPSSMPEMLRQRDRQAAGMTAPAHGLVLWRVFYK